MNIKNEKASDGTIFLQGVTVCELVEILAERLKPVMLVSESNNKHKELLTCKEVEKMLDISHQTRLDWTNAGRLISYTNKGSRRLYYKRSEIMDGLIQIEKY